MLKERFKIDRSRTEKICHFSVTEIQPKIYLSYFSVDVLKPVNENFKFFTADVNRKMSF